MPVSFWAWSRLPTFLPEGHLCRVSKLQRNQRGGDSGSSGCRCCNVSAGDTNVGARRFWMNPLRDPARPAVGDRPGPTFCSCFSGPGIDAKDPDRECNIRAIQEITQLAEVEEGHTERQPRVLPVFYWIFSLLFLMLPAFCHSNPPDTRNVCSARKYGTNTKAPTTDHPPLPLHRPRPSSRICFSQEMQVC